jgi:hypothetical protein
VWRMFTSESQTWWRLFALDTGSNRILSDWLDELRECKSIWPPFQIEIELAKLKIPRSPSRGHRTQHFGTRVLNGKWRCQRRAAPVEVPKSSSRSRAQLQGKTSESALREWKIKNNSLAPQVKRSYILNSEIRPP